MTYDPNRDPEALRMLASTMVAKRPSHHVIRQRHTDSQLEPLLEYVSGEAINLTNVASMRLCKALQVARAEGVTSDAFRDSFASASYLVRDADSYRELAVSIDKALMLAREESA